MIKSGLFIPGGACKYCNFGYIINVPSFIGQTNQRMEWNKFILYSCIWDQQRKVPSLLDIGSSYYPQHLYESQTWCHHCWTTWPGGGKSKERDEELLNWRGLMWLI